MHSRRLFALLALSVGVSPSARAQINSFQSGTTYQATAVNRPDVTGADMAGLQVEWTFADLTTGQGTWGAIDGGSCGINSGGFRLFMGCDDDTVLGTWTLLNVSGQTLVGVRLRSASAGVVFDCGWLLDQCATVGTGFDDGDGWGTAGSVWGITHERTGGSYTATTIGTYRNRVGVGGAAPVGDLFEEFSLFLDGMSSGESYQFMMDADGVTDLAPQTVVPEPTTWSLLVVGATLLLVVLRRWPGARTW